MHNHFPLDEVVAICSRNFHLYHFADRANGLATIFIIIWWGAFRSA